MSEVLRQLAGALSQLAARVRHLETVEVQAANLPAHALVGAIHTASGLTIGYVPRASGATTFTWAQLQHTDLGTIGTNTHAQIDTHIAATSAHGASSNPGAASAMLKTDASGLVQLVGLGLGVAPGTFVLYATEADYADVATVERAPGASTNAAWTGGRVNVLSTADAIDGLGPLLEFSMTDTGVTRSPLGYVGARRSGADNSGRVVLMPSSAGTAVEALTVYPSRGVYIGSTPADPGANNLKVEGNLRVGNTNYWTLAGWTTNADAAINGYVTVTVDGTTRKLATIA